MIIALGEVIVAIGLPVVAGLEAGSGVPARTVVVLVAAGAFAALLWWAYFDRPGPALEHRAQGIDDPIESARFVRDVYTGAHSAIVAGVIVTAAALEEIALHPEAEVATAFRVMLFGGLVLLGGGVAIAIWRAFSVIARERLAAAAVVGVVLALGGAWDGVVLLVVVDLVVLTALFVEHRRIEH